MSLMGLWGLFFINKHYFIIWNANNVTVITQPPLDSKKVKIEFGVSVNTINRANDLDLFKNRSKYIVVYNGQNLTEIDNEYGENDFLITYDDLYYLSDILNCIIEVNMTTFSNSVKRMVLLQ